MVLRLSPLERRAMFLIFMNRHSPPIRVRSQRKQQESRMRAAPQTTKERVLLSRAMRTPYVAWRDAVAVVTGAASGIGRALAEELSGRGAEVVLADRQM